MPSNTRYSWLILINLLMLGLASPAWAESLRIHHILRCGDIFFEGKQEFCLQFSGGTENQQVRIRLNGKILETKKIKSGDDLLFIKVSGDRHKSGPLWLEQGDAISNPIWLSLAGSHVVAANETEVAKNMDGLTTYVDLVSLIIEESHDGLKAAQALAKKYNATIVGMIPPLNTYQLRLPAKNLIERDAMVLRLGSELAVDAVIIEESNPEEEIEEEEKYRTSLDKINEEWASNRFLDAVDFYQRRLAGDNQHIKATSVRIGVIERNVDFDSPDFKDYIGDCRRDWPRTCLYARDAKHPDEHGSTVSGILAAAWNDKGGGSGFLRGLDKVGPGFEIIVDRNSDAGITANIAASVNMVEDGVRVLNWSWGIHRVGTKNINGEDIDSLVRSGLAMSGYEELLEEFFLWLRAKHPDVVVVNSAGNGASFSGRDEYRLPSSFVTEQLFVVGGHERSGDPDAKISDADYVVKRNTSNIDMRVDITAAACVRSSTLKPGVEGNIHCGTSYSTPLVTGLIAAMLSINPNLEPEQLRILLRRSAMTIGEEADFEPTDADDLTSPILPSERSHDLNHPDVGLSARLNMHRALDLTVKSLSRVR